MAGAEEQYSLTMSNAIGFIPSSSEYTCRIDDRNLKINCLNHKDSKGNYQQRKKAVSKTEQPDLLEITQSGTCNQEYPCMCASPNLKCSCLCYFEDGKKIYQNCSTECMDTFEPFKDAKPFIFLETLGWNGQVEFLCYEKNKDIIYDCDKNGKPLELNPSECDQISFGEKNHWKDCKKSDATKWKEKCDDELKDAGKSSFAANSATAYCTRYNSELLEEIRNNQ